MLQHHGLLWEYYRKGMELVPLELKPVLDDLYKGRAFQYLTRGCVKGGFYKNISLTQTICFKMNRAVPILENVPREPNYKNGVTFYVGKSPTIEWPLSRNKRIVKRIALPFQSVENSSVRPWNYLRS